MTFGTVPLPHDEHDNVSGSGYIPEVGIAAAQMAGGGDTDSQGTTSAPYVVALSRKNAAVPANTAANLVIKASPGTLCTMTVTTAGTAALSFYDNATTNSGTILHTIPANAAVGTIYQLYGAATNGIVAAGVANCPGVTAYYS